MKLPGNVSVLGRGGRMLIVIPGLSVTKVGGDPAALKNAFRPFLEDFTVYFVDRRDSVLEGCTSRDLAQMVYEDLSALLPFKADVIGVSQGAMMAQWFAADHPEAVRKLVLAATLCRRNAVLEESMTTWIRLASEKRYAELNRDMFGRIYSPAFREANARALEYAEKTMVPDSDERFIRLARACLEHDSVEALKLISCPVLVAGSRSDAVLSYAGSEEIAAALGCDLVTYEGYGHAFYDENTEFYRSAYLFLIG